MDIQKALEEINVLIKSVTDPVAKAIISHLLNIIEYQAQEIKMLREENQKLRDEINRLKGEQGKPHIRAKSRKNISSEKERNQHNKVSSSKPMVTSNTGSNPSSSSSTASSFTEKWTKELKSRGYQDHQYSKR